MISTLQTTLLIANPLVCWMRNNILIVRHPNTCDTVWQYSVAEDDLLAALSSDPWSLLCLR